jgi:hypothetical protein
VELFYAASADSACELRAAVAAEKLTCSGVAAAFFAFDIGFLFGHCQQLVAQSRAQFAAALADNLALIDFYAAIQTIHSFHPPFINMSSMGLF